MRGVPLASRSRGFTLVELLLAMVIAAVLAGTALMALWGAQEEARAARTRSQIAKINELLLGQWQSFASRNLPVTSSPPAPNIPGRDKMLIRLMLLRDAMRMEMPDRKSDLEDAKVVFTYASTDWTLASEPRLWRQYQRRIIALAGDMASWSLDYQGAECLYLIVAAARDSQSNGLDFFTPSEIGDIDGDGVPEIHDGWGRPISFLRWAPGFASDLQPNIHELIANPLPAGESPGYDPDHLDPLKVDPRWSSTSSPFKPFLLVPLIYSAGADGEYAIVTDNDWTGTNGPFHYSARWNDPYDALDDSSPTGGEMYIGEPLAGAFWPTGGHYAEDNITNHLIEVR